ncbi:MAG: hypothetical protein UR96_C0034G0002 [candidate division WS6 bacterium GW2011_GWC1_36_11]|uniref:Uncharacterized protein n=1 Tax=candidate division WS6 bacterium GW2011_GWC1_36_11 TaxID=1619090 RepID=A0A0G0FUS9_9BACT|nr:MAG: hypothetical protein UR96_C0034G0002 [candidate division WS6 bacterium GW2011_GWC1_36_11]
MNNDVNTMLENLGKNPFSGLSINVTSLLKFPLVIILFGNVLFAALLFLRSRILADTFESSSIGIIKTIITIYLITTIIGSIIAVLFLLVG